jgi:cell wall-associated NlpC family hydrolase
MKRIFLFLIVFSLSFNVKSQTLPTPDDFKQYVDWLGTKDSTLVNFMKEWIGSKYKLGGNTKSGIDCSQFNKRLYKDVYGLDLENVCYKQWNQTRRIVKDSLQVGDLLFFRSKASPSGWHCGTYIGNRMFIHAANRYENVKLSCLDEPKYLKSYRGAGRLEDKTTQ